MSISATLQALGVRLTGRVVAAMGDRIAFADDLPASVTSAQAKLERLLARIDAFAGFGRDSPHDAIAPVDLSRDAPLSLSTDAENIRTVVWATGYRRAFPWLRVPGAVGTDGEIAHVDGVTAVPGLYALGFRLLRKRDSHFIGGVGSDAVVLAQQISAHLRQSQQIVPPRSCRLMLHIIEFEPHYDAIIVGARCAGAATAMLLARAGLRVLAVDRQSYGSDTLSTHALMRPAVMQLSRWGLLQPLIRSGAPVIASTTFHYGEQEVTVPIRPEPGIPGLIAPRRTVLDRMLVDAARAAGATVLHDTPVHDLMFDPHGRVRGVVLRDAAGRTRKVGADLRDRRRRTRLACRSQGRGTHAGAADGARSRMCSATPRRRRFRDITGISAAT